ncbi:MAG: putative metal-binding motif-containing protein, partial [archaeon]
DIDGDGISNDIDVIKGDKSHISYTNVPDFGITVGDDSNLSQAFTGFKMVKFKSGTNTLVEGNWSFDEDELDLEHIDFQAASGYVYISGFDPTGFNKTVYLTKAGGNDTICVNNEYSDPAINCMNPDDFEVVCNGTVQSGINCTDLGTRFKIEGLEHSGVRHLLPFGCTDADIDGYSPDGDYCGAIDCNDADSTIHPGATDTCGNSIDEDCSGADLACSVTPPGPGGGSSGGSGSGGGGGGGGAWAKTYNITDAQCAAGYTLDLGARQRAQFMIGGSKPYFIGVTSVTNNSVTLDVSGTGAPVTLGLHTEKKFDFNGDGAKDILVLYSDYKAAKAYVKFTCVHEAAAAAPATGAAPAEQKQEAPAAAAAKKAGIFESIMGALMPITKKITPLMFIIIIIVVVCAIGGVAAVRLRKPKTEQLPAEYAPQQQAQQQVQPSMDRAQAKQQALYPYIKENLNRGIAAEEIYNALVEAGWPADLAQEAIDDFYRQRQGQI